MMTEPQVEARNITRFIRHGGAEGREPCLMPGEVHALIGKNGAGKSSLVKILSARRGPRRPHPGGRAGGGTPSPGDAFQKGIATVYQELSLVPGLSVAHNMLLPNLPTKFGGICIDWAAVYDRAAYSRKPEPQHQSPPPRQYPRDGEPADGGNRQGDVVRAGS